METTALFTANNIWMMICTALVFFMHLGFSFLEIGLTRQKNTINILFKNFFVITVGLLLYAIGGFNLMYPGSISKHGTNNMHVLPPFSYAIPRLLFLLCKRVRFQLKDSGRFVQDLILLDPDSVA